jgi:hypothetical protein
MRLLVWCGLVMAWAVPALAQDVEMGPPPELRKNLDAFQVGVNGTVAEFEAMAKATFSPVYFKSQTAEQRAELYKKLRTEFGTLKFQQIERSGPDAPLVIQVAGSTASGTVWIDLDVEHRVAGIRSQIRSTGGSS